MSYPYIVQGNNITVVIGSTPHTISKTHVTFQKVLDAIKANDWDTVRDVIEPKKVVLNYGQGNISIQGDTLFWRGQEMHNALTTRIIQMLQDGFPVEPMVNFMENLMANPSKRAVSELYRFLEKNSLPITPDGCFLAYKRVRENYFDVHSGTVDNKPAYMIAEVDRKPSRTDKGVTVSFVEGEKVISMDRNQVDDDRDNTCSEGLHFCSKDYLNHFGGSRVLILKIDPRNVVSIPSDYNDAKGRACQYIVVGEVGVDPDSIDTAFTKPVQADANHTETAKTDGQAGSWPQPQ